MSGQIRRLSKARFDALSFSKQPSASLFSEAYEWYSDKDEVLIGVVLRDTIDDDWAFVVLGRDEAGMFRGISQGINLRSQKDARDALRSNIRRIKTTEQTVFPQDKRPKRKQDIFVPVVPHQRLHPYFVKVANDLEFSAAREILREIGYSYSDPDGNFVEQFQTTGFNSRLWEIYLHAYLHEEEFWVDRSHPYPDYMCRKGDQTIFIEAVTVNPSSNKGLVEDPPDSPKEVFERLQDFMPIKFGSALFSKLSKRYWEVEHVKGHPLIFAIQDFHQEQSMLWSSTALPIYLYGTKYSWYHDADGNLIIVPEKLEKHKHGEKEVPAGFFFQPGAENISAVLFSNSATISKFNRMGKLARFGDPAVKMTRSGFKHDPDTNAAVPIVFSVEVDPKTYQEYWADGLSMYHNPRALHPIAPEVFPSVAHHFFENGGITSYAPEFYVYGSFTHVLVPRGKGRAPASS
jgi:hypothetical protein